MQAQLLIICSSSDIPLSGILSGASICYSDSSSEEMMRREEAASWQCFFSNTWLDWYTWPCRWHFFFLIVPWGYSFKNNSTASPYLSLLWSLSNPIFKRISSVMFQWLTFFWKKCATNVRRVSLTLHWITEQQDISLECATSFEFPNCHQCEK